MIENGSLQTLVIIILNVSGEHVLLESNDSTKKKKQNPASYLLQVAETELRNARPSYIKKK